MHIDDLPVVATVSKLVYNKILNTRVESAVFQNIVAKHAPVRILDFTWNGNSSQDNVNTIDVANVVCYDEELRNFEIYQTIVTIADLAAQVIILAFCTGLNVHIWMYFNTEDERLACNSGYIGAIFVQ